MPSPLPQIRQLDKKSERFLDTLFETVDDWLCDGKLGEVDKLLKDVNPIADSEVLCLGALTISCAARDKLLEYKNLYNRLYVYLNDTRGEEYAKSALYGLEPWRKYG